MSKVSKLGRKDDNLPSETADSGVIMKMLKLPYLPINVQHSDESVLLPRNLQHSVYPGHDAVKQVGVDLLGEGVSGVDRPLPGLRLHQRLSRQNDPAMAQPACQPLCLHGQQLAEDSQVRVTELKEGGGRRSLDGFPGSSLSHTHGSSDSQKQTNRRLQNF